MPETPIQTKRSCCASGRDEVEALLVGEEAWGEKRVPVVERVEAAVEAAKIASGRRGAMGSSWSVLANTSLNASCEAV